MRQMFIQADANWRARKQYREGLLAYLQRVVPQVIPVKLDDVERPHEHTFVRVPSPDQLEAGNTVRTARDRLAIDGARAWPKPRQCLDNEREAPGQIIAWAAVEFHPLVFCRSIRLTRTNWPAPGSADTELGALMELEVGHGETEVYPRVQA